MSGWHKTAKETPFQCEMVMVADKNNDVHNFLYYMDVNDSGEKRWFAYNEEYDAENGVLGDEMEAYPYWMDKPLRPKL